ncbi:MAG TPA: SRPBCC family protein [Steroidobacteraceae bacterium]|nr:SRPBCC family protein [Steroidobacteraceae bacterium]
MKITIETVVKAQPAEVWKAWNTPEDIVRWNSPHESWHTTRSAVDLREGGKFSARMEARDGSAGFDFEGTCTRVVPNQHIDFRMDDGREVNVEFIGRDDGVLVRETFDTESENPVEMQRAGWQAILDNFGRHVEMGTVPLS